MKYVGSKSATHGGRRLSKFEYAVREYTQYLGNKPQRQYQHSTGLVALLLESAARREISPMLPYGDTQASEA